MSEDKERNINRLLVVMEAIETKEKLIEQLEKDIDGLVAELKQIRKELKPTQTIGFKQKPINAK